jgi:hypothetical protein
MSDCPFRQDHCLNDLALATLGDEAREVIDGSDVAQGGSDVEPARLDLDEDIGRRTQVRLEPVLDRQHPVALEDRRSPLAVPLAADTILPAGRRWMR